MKFRPKKHKAIVWGVRWQEQYREYGFPEFIVEELISRFSDEEPTMYNANYEMFRLIKENLDKIFNALHVASMWRDFINLAICFPDKRNRKSTICLTIRMKGKRLLNAGIDRYEGTLPTGDIIWLEKPDKDKLLEEIELLEYPY